MTAPGTTEYLLLTAPDHELGRPPAVEQIVGAWQQFPDGSRGRFEPNPLFVPSGVDTPTDPFDAVSRLWARGEVDTAALVDVLNDAVFEVAVDEAGLPLITALADGSTCVTVATAPAHRLGSALPRWDAATLDDLGPILPTGTGIAVNPQSQTPVLLRR